MKLLVKSKYVLVIVFASLVLFWKFFLKGWLPFPSDALVGMYHPWRDSYSTVYPNGIPFNNPLITDPVRQSLIWKKLVADSYRSLELPVYNSFSFAGYPLLANFQSGVFYPLNIFFLFLPIELAWTMYIFSQFVLGGIFMMFFLEQKCNNRFVAIQGALIWMVSGFWVAWAEWGNVLHTALWLPLLLLTIEKILRNEKKYLIIYFFILLSAFSAGHLQTFFYLFLFSLAYFFSSQSIRAKSKELKRIIGQFITVNLIFLCISTIQWLPTFKLITTSTRAVETAKAFQREDWFIPVKHLAQLVVPDFFGNPAKGNYWGVWNYGEFISYLGIWPLIFAVFGIWISIRRKINQFFFWSLLIVACLAIRNPISEILYTINLPFYSTAQPSRLIFLIDFILSFFAVFGWQQFFLKNEKGLLTVAGGILILMSALVSSALFLKDHRMIILRNCCQPVIVFFLGLGMIIAYLKLRKQTAIGILLLMLIFLDQGRVWWKFNTFSAKNYFFPETKIISFLKKESEQEIFRISTLDPKIFPSNVNAFYKIESIDGYDSLFYQDYADFIGQTKNANFNRIVSLTAYDRRIFQALNVKYLVSLVKQSSPDLSLVMEEGQTKLYLNRFFQNRFYFSNPVNQIKVINRRYNSYSLIAQITDTDILNISIPYDSAWHLFVNGTETSLLKDQNGLMKAKIISSGKLILKYTLL